MDLPGLLSPGRAGTALLCLSAALFFFPPRLDGPINPQDEGTWLALAQSAAGHKALYRDTACQFGPLLYFPLKVASTLRAPTLSRVRWIFWGENLLGLWLLLLALWRLSPPSALRAAFAVFLGVIPFAAHTMTIPYAARFGAGFLPMLLWPEVSDDDPRRAFLAGVLGGVAFWVSQEVGVAALAAGTFLYWAVDRAGPRSRAHAAGAAAALLVGLACIAATAGLRNYGASSVTDIGLLVLRRRQPFPPWTGGWVNTAEALAGRGPALICLGTLASSFFRRKNTDEDLRPAALAVYGLVAAASAWARSDRWHIYFALAPAVLLSALWAGRWFKAGGRRGQWGCLALTALCALATLPPYFERRAKDRALAWASRRVDLPRAGRARLPSGQAAGYELLTEEVHRRVPPGAPFFYYPFNGAAYFMMDRPNPCRWPLPVDALRPEQQEQMVRQIEAAQVRWVVRDRHVTAFDGVPIEKVLPRLDRYLTENFVPRAEAGPFIFLERKDRP